MHDIWFSKVEMPPLKFHKYHGAGNSIIIVDNREGEHSGFFRDPDLRKRMCDWNFGVGCNALMELRSHSAYPFPFEMVCHTPLGDVTQMCGNGGRTIAAFHFTHGSRSGNWSKKRNLLA